MKKIYLAIPYSGIENQSFKTANYVAGNLMSRGNIVFSPISHNHPIACEYGLRKDWEFWREFDMCFIKFCDELCIVCLDGWKESIGIKGEIEIAKKYKKKITFIDV